MPEHDAAYKLLFSEPRLVADLFRGFVDAEITRELDLSTLEKCAGSYVADDLREREDDVVWRVQTKGGHDIYVYLLLEFQSTVDEHMALRIRTYADMLRQDLVRQKRLPPSGKLPTIVPTVLYNGDRPWTSPAKFEDLLEPMPAVFERFKNPDEFILIEERSIPVEKLCAGENLVSLLFRLEQSETVEAIQEAIDSFWPWLGAEGLESAQNAFARWVSRVVKPARAGEDEERNDLTILEVRSMLAERVRRWTREWKAEGVAEGESKGRMEGEVAGEVKTLKSTLIDALDARFGTVDAPIRERISGLPDAVVLKKLHREAILAESMESFIALLNEQTG